jgi:hypothetical protein
MVFNTTFNNISVISGGQYMWRPSCYSCYTFDDNSWWGKAQIVIMTNGTYPWYFFLYKIPNYILKLLIFNNEHLKLNITSSSAVFSDVCVVRSLVFCVVFCWSLFVLLSFFLFCPSIYGFWLPIVLLLLHIRW